MMCQHLPSHLCIMNLFFQIISSVHLCLIIMVSESSISISVAWMLHDLHYRLYGLSVLVFLG